MIHRPPRRLAAPLLISLSVLASGCAARPPPTWTVEDVPVDLETACATGTAVPRGVTVIRSTEGEARSSRTYARTSAERATGPDTLVVAGEACLFTVDLASGATTRLKVGDGPFAPTRVGAATGYLVMLDEDAGTIRWMDVRTGGISRTLVHLQRPVDLAVLPGGAALVVEYNGGRVMELKPGEDARPLLVGAGLGAPVAVVAPTPRDSYVVDGPGGQILRVGLKMATRAPVVTGLHRPEGLVSLQDGRLATIETATGRLLAVDPKLGTMEVLAAGLPIRGPGDPDLPTLSLARGSGATLYLADPLGRRLLRIAPPPAPPAAAH
jgi:hypothetical protein